MRLCWIVYFLVIVGLLGDRVKGLPLFQLEQTQYEHYNPEENLGVNIFLTEGDILIDRRRSLDFQYYKTWYNRSVPYVFESHFPIEAQRLVEVAIADIQNSTCVRFKRRQSEKDYIRFIKPEVGCYSPVGRVGGLQDISLADGCLVHGVIQHEILHALGLWHEQSRRDRDEYVRVEWYNIAKEHQSNFLPHPSSQSHELLLAYPYDYGSIMHYSNNTFAVDKQKATLVPKRDLPAGVVMGQRLALSVGDKDKLNALYRCDISNCSEPGTLPNGWIDGGDYSVGSRIYYSCNPGYVLIGARERVCRDLGEWSGENPTCLAFQHGRLRYCNFDNQTAPFCGWTQSNDDDLDWTLLMGPTMSEGTGPDLDHTLGTVYGTYAYVEASSRNPKQKARLVSPVMTFSQTRACLVFFASMYGEAMGNLTVYQSQGNRSPSESNILITLIGNQGPQWKQVFLMLERTTAAFSIVFEGSLGNGYTSDIAIDDIVIGDCSLFKPLATSGGLTEAIQCSFDAGLCGFIQDRRDDIDWTLNVGKTATFETGPDCDPHDCQNGQYLYIESSRPRVMGNRASLKTPVIGGEGRRCLAFYYHMYGEHIGSLTVRMTSAISGIEQILWAASGDQGNRWYSQQIDFIALEAYQISFDATVGPSYKGDIAIDSIGINTGRCQETQQFNCSFTHDLCGWVNAPTPGDMLDWTRHRGETDSPETGPTSDRLSPTGYYVYVESSRTIAGDKARLVSPTIRHSSSGYCLQFWYHMYGRTSGNLTVLSQSVIGQEVILWSRQGDQGSVWRFQMVNITNTGGRDFNVIFEATMAGFTGDVAIDDVGIHESLCALR